MEGKQLGPRWGGDAGRFAAFPHAGYTGSEASPWVAAGHGFMGKEGQYYSSVPRAEKYPHPSWAWITLLAFSLHTWHLWNSQIPLVGVGLCSGNWRLARAAVGQVHVFWLKPPNGVPATPKMSPVKDSLTHTLCFYNSEILSLSVM